MLSCAVLCWAALCCAVLFQITLLAILYFRLIITPPLSKGKGYYKIHGLLQDCSNSIVNALELLPSCTKPSRCTSIIPKQCVWGVNSEIKLVLYLGSFTLKCEIQNWILGKIHWIFTLVLANVWYQLFPGKLMRGFLLRYKGTSCSKCGMAGN